MTQTPSIPSCTNDLRHYLRPLPTTDELFHVKQYFHYQKQLRIRLINYHRLLLSESNRRVRRYNHTLYPDKQIFEKYGLSPFRSNPNVLFTNSRRFNRALNSLPIHRNSSHRIKTIQIYTHSESEENSIPSIENNESQPNTTIIRLNTCATIIATGHGMAMKLPPENHTNIEQFNINTIDEDISLSKICRKLENRFFYQPPINPQSSSIYLFTIPDKVSQHVV